MIKAEFGIIDNIDPGTDYTQYEPQKYHCIVIDDALYIDDWWNRLELIKTFFHSLKRPAFALARWGITLIPPESLSAFQDIVISDRRINYDDHLVALAEMIGLAIRENKYMIHYGV